MRERWNESKKKKKKLSKGEGTEGNLLSLPPSPYLPNFFALEIG